MVRRVRAARHIVDKERLVWIHGLEALHVLDGVIGHCRGQVPAGVPYIRIDFRSVAEEVGLPLIGVAADESIEIVEAHANRPLIKWTRLARRERRSVVVLAEPR